MNKGYLKSYDKTECFGCESCAQVCPKSAISIQEDEEGFRYPIVDGTLCVHCGLCNRVCPYENIPLPHKDKKYVFGGYIKDEKVRDKSTSGGAFSAIADVWCDENYAIFGAAAEGLEVYHTYVTNKEEIQFFRKSKYSQSRIGTVYADAKRFLKDGKKVLFSGTPCQIAGLKAFLRDTDQTGLLTIEVVCEGVPSPWYVRKYNEHCVKKYGLPIETLDYRYKDNKKWDFQVMLTKLRGVQMKKDRWFNPFWSIWLNHLMSRPSCYHCPFAKPDRNSDITLGDLWGVHIYCPELYGHNGGTSLVVCNTKKGKDVMKQAEDKMYGHELDFVTALKYQGPMRKPIAENPERASFMKDLTGNMTYQEINKKWAEKPTLKLLWSKYVWGNRQKVWFWNLTHSKHKQKNRKQL